MKIDEATYTVFDFETTGLFPYAGDRICEIGAVRIKPGHPREIFQTMIDPQRPVSYGAFRINGISQDMVKGKPLISEVIPGFLKFIEGSVLVAYNSGFDLGFLESALGDDGELLQNFRVIDALKLARSLFPEARRYNLGFLAESLGISTDGQHRALADAIITAKVFQKEIDILLGKNINSVDEIAEAPMIRKIFKPGTGDALFETIRAAIDNQNTLHITYRSSWDNTMSERTITPREIKNGFDRRYVIAYCHLKKEVRNFRMDCILSAKSV